MSNDLAPAEMVPVMLGEARRWRLPLAVVFAVIALAALVVGALWPKTYQSSTTILVQKSNIITPLMEGRAVTTSSSYRASIARELLFSHQVMQDILKTGGWLASDPSPLEIDRLVDQIQDRTTVSSSRDNLIQITYADTDPERSYKVTQRYAQLFIQESLKAKMRESRAAFEFIDSQVKSYHSKLAAAEAKLDAYRDAHPEARGSSTATSSRISALRSDIEQARMQLTEDRANERILEAQLAGESEIATVDTRSDQIGAQLAKLQTQLQTLLLTYTNAYPDVVRTRHQIQDLKHELAQENARKDAARRSGAPEALDSTVQFNPLYQKLRAQLATTRRSIAATLARMHASEQLLAAEQERGKLIADSTSAIEGLTRDYEVDRDVYQDLLKRRENARVSMNLDAKHRGLNFSIQDPAVLPLRPHGLRFVHFSLAGLALACAVPIGLLVGLTRFDPRVRSAGQLERQGVPLLAIIPTYVSSSEQARQRRISMKAALIVVLVIAAYLVAAWMKLEKLL
ncbi:MAG TPA: XrtA system polysaccharide chain length determinant [Rhodanobacteraceae bacterium]|nr:XrtA system polysaccharide chain length determinant [Rhodanobacteraceae bacterium]